MTQSQPQKDRQPKEHRRDVAACGSAAERICPTCHCPVTSPYALTCPRCRAQLPPMPDCTTCGAGCHAPPPAPRRREDEKA